MTRRRSKSKQSDKQNNNGVSVLSVTDGESIEESRRLNAFRQPSSSPDDKLRSGLSNKKRNDESATQASARDFKSFEIGSLSCGLSEMRRKRPRGEPKKTPIVLTQGSSFQDESPAIEQDQQPAWLQKAKEESSRRQRDSRESKKEGKMISCRRNKEMEEEVDQVDKVLSSFR